MNSDNKSTLVWQNCMLTTSATIRQAIEILNEVGVQILLIVDKDKKLLGTLSDGDVRRGLIKGLTLFDSIDSLVERKPLVVPSTMSRNLVLKLMAANKIHQVPIVDEENNVVGIHLWDEMTVPAQRSNTMVIMAGGKGTRMHPYTDSCPKPMLKVGGKPMLEHIINRAKAEGFSNFVISVNYLANKIEDYFGSGESLSVSIRYLRESRQLGTAGALSLFSEIPAEPIIVINGDVMTNIRYGDFLDFHYKYDSKATMAVSLHEWQNPYGVVRLNGLTIVGFEEKPTVKNYVNAGVYALSPDVINLLSSGDKCDMPTLFERANHFGMKVIAYPMHELWIDVGTPPDLSRANDLSFVREGDNLD